MRVKYTEILKQDWMKAHAMVNSPIEEALESGWLFLSHSGLSVDDLYRGFAFHHSSEDFEQ